ncbi:beta family protein [bacterium]|nr:beta family protein [bacterium]
MIYAPVLRLKQSEWLALKELKEKEKDVIVPIIEPTLWYFNTQDNSKLEPGIKKTTKKLFESWGARKAFLDPYIIEHKTDIEYFANHFFDNSRETGLLLSPVVSLKSSKKYLNSIRLHANKRGLALRINSIDISSTDCNNKINSILGFLNTSRKNIDLIYDYKLLEGNFPALHQIAGKIQNLSDWKSFIMLGGSFPQYASIYSIDLHNIERKEWSLWLNALNGKKLVRIPFFGDYTIQHPIYSEPPAYITPSASVRYTTEKDWLLLRGESLKKGARYNQYPAHALMIKEHDDFYGKDFSFGDKYIFEMAEKMEKGKDEFKTGSPQSWLKVGINHHLTVVIHQIANINVI